MPIILKLLVWQINIFTPPLITVKCYKQIYATVLQKLNLLEWRKPTPQLTKARRCCHLWGAMKLLM